ncbi:PREDICTED: F-box protein PP2-A15-like [Nicotiana attenuata]|uniref:F-box protein pp2-a15 n=1 Tax=Nicotiana attenuata TaxID=49451 RepID=A0A1J6IUR6_NICAT|nr:PREDICTED: F-box protein PP2-A15-like [Nicotiana attenuata]OIT01447.1 f-box protein pp2-a15 [Nicotiana attenuata]
MGASLSNLTENESTGPGLGDIPENCVACVFMYLTPPEICNLARLNRAFRGAASSDAVWNSKLPSNYHYLLDLLPLREKINEGLSKKDIFALLSRPVPFDDGNKEVWLDRISGRICMSISTKAMLITGVEDRRHWNWFPTEESRFHVVAYCQQVWWFEVSGSVKFPFPPDVYMLTFRVHLGKFYKRLGRRVSSFEHTHGWDLGPVRYELTTSDGQHAVSEYFIHDIEQDDANGYIKRGNWIEYKVGEFIVSRSDPATEVRFSMKQIDCTHSKGGLCVDSVSIAPSNLKGRRRKGVLKYQ